jgi:hypothetical protein
MRFITGSRNDTKKISVKELFIALTTTTTTVTTVAATAVTSFPVLSVLLSAFSLPLLFPSVFPHKSK